MAANGCNFARKWSWGTFDAARAGQIIGYDATLMVFEFTMIDKAVTAVVECQISSVAMDQLAAVVKVRCRLKEKRNFCTCGRRLSELPLIFTTKDWRHRAG